MKHTSPTRPGYFKSKPPLQRDLGKHGSILVNGQSKYLDTPAASPPFVSHATAPTVSCRTCPGTSLGLLGDLRYSIHLRHSFVARAVTNPSGVKIGKSCEAANARAPSETRVLRGIRGRRFNDKWKRAQTRVGSGPGDQAGGSGLGWHVRVGSRS
jgi:hypothetical protein